jgi:hypothetical protein
MDRGAIRGLSHKRKAKACELRDVAFALDDDAAGTA